jgi:hypothetical protein
VKVNGEVKSIGVYPSRDELATWSSLTAPVPGVVTEPASPAVELGGCCGPAKTEESAPKAGSGGCCGPAKSGCC